MSGNIYIHLKNKSARDLYGEWQNALAGKGEARNPLVRFLIKNNFGDVRPFGSAPNLLHVRLNGFANVPEAKTMLSRFPDVSKVTTDGLENGADNFGREEDDPFFDNSRRPTSDVMKDYIVVAGKLIRLREG